MIWAAKEDINAWEKCFLFFPKKLIDGRTAWLHIVERLFIPAPNQYGVDMFEYREIKK